MTTVSIPMWMDFAASCVLSDDASAGCCLRRKRYMRMRTQYLEHMLFLWASYQIRQIAGAHAPGMLGTFSLPPHVSDPDMHHGTCVTHVP